MAEKAGDIYVDVGARFDKLDKQLNKLSSRMDKGVGQSTKALSTQFAKLGGVIAGAFTVGAAIDLQKRIVGVTSEFQKFNAVLKNTLGSQQAADKAFQKIKVFAAETPFAVVELTDAFVRLANQGFRPTIEEMRKLGDLASSTGKSFLQLSEAIIDAQVGEFERLKEFGIRAEKAGDKVTFTFKGVKQEVEFASGAIQDYLVGLGDIEGVSGAAAAISQTLGGKINNLGDSFDNLLYTIGTKQSGALVTAITQLSNAISWLNDELDDSKVTQFDVGYDLLFDGLSKTTETSKLLEESLGRQFTIMERAKILANGFTDAQIAAADAQLQLNNELKNAPMGPFIEELENTTDAAWSFSDSFLQLADSAKEFSEKIKYPIGSLGALQEKMKELNEQKLFAGTREEMEAVEAKILTIYNQIQELTQREHIIVMNVVSNSGGVPQVAGNMEGTTPEDIAAGQELHDYMDTADATIQKNSELADSFGGMSNQIGNSIGDMAAALVKGNDEGADAMDKGANKMRDAVIQIMAQSLAAATAQAIAGGASAGSTMGPAAIAAIPAFIGALVATVSSAFTSIPAFAKGGQMHGSGMALVGERGPELVNLPNGSFVKNNHSLQSGVTGMGTEIIIPEVKMSGYDLYLNFKRQEKKVSRR